MKQILETNITPFSAIDLHFVSFLFVKVDGPPNSSISMCK